MMVRSVQRHREQAHPATARAVSPIAAPAPDPRNPAVRAPLRPRTTAGVVRDQNRAHAVAQAALRPKAARRLEAAHREPAPVAIPTQLAVRAEATRPPRNPLRLLRVPIAIERAILTLSIANQMGRAAAHLVASFNAPWQVQARGEPLCSVHSRDAAGSTRPRAAIRRAAKSGSAPPSMH